ncbi:response regulator transcription factor [Nocardioides ungokensis]|uniref:response regulator transcription factor n=1 Tax=Nocardioides ungokensis TaxID=1643322 RepID=UPI001FE2C786|nr:response regulator [Nocardioides ungokensis]
MTTIGVCEDDAQLRSVITRAFKAEDFDVVSVATGAEALRAFVERQPDVIVLDLGLPDVDGRDVCLALKANGVVAPVLMLTARTGVHHKVAGFEAGADDYLGKPFAGRADGPGPGPRAAGDRDAADTGGGAARPGDARRRGRRGVGGTDAHRVRGAGSPDERPR